MTFYNGTTNLLQLYSEFNLTVDYQRGVWNISRITTNGTYYFYQNLTLTPRNFTHIGRTTIDLFDGRRIGPDHENVTCTPFHFLVNFTNMTGESIPGATCTINMTGVSSGATVYHAPDGLYNYSMTCTATYYQTQVGTNQSHVAQLVNLLYTQALDSLGGAVYQLNTSMTNLDSCIVNATHPRLFLENVTTAVSAPLENGSIALSGEHSGNLSIFNETLGAGVRQTYEANVSYVGDFRIGDMQILGGGPQLEIASS